MLDRVKYYGDRTTGDNGLKVSTYLDLSDIIIENEDNKLRHNLCEKYNAIGLCNLTQEQALEAIKVYGNK